MKLRICFKVNGLARDEAGLPCPAGMCLSMEAEKEIPYEQLCAAVDKEALLHLAGLDTLVTPDDMEFITPEEYDREYGDEDE